MTGEAAREGLWGPEALAWVLVRSTSMGDPNIDEGKCPSLGGPDVTGTSGSLLVGGRPMVGERERVPPLGGTPDAVREGGASDGQMAKMGAAPVSPWEETGAAGG